MGGPIVSAQQEILEKESTDEEKNENSQNGDPLTFFPDFDGTQDSTEIEAKKVPDWKDEAYWRLPENVRHAIDGAKMKSKHSDFWYRLQTMNDKIFVYRTVFYGNMPSYQQQFHEKKRKELEQRLKAEKEQYEKEMNEMH